MKRPAKQYTVQLDPEFVEKVDKMADRLGLSRSQIMRNLMMSGYEDAELLDRFGLFSAFRLGQKVMAKIKEGIASGSIRVTREGDLKIEE
jgi:predicted transcriptional regulator